MASFYGATLSLLSLLSIFVSCHTANHYCVQDLMSTIMMDGFYHRDETIIPLIPGDMGEDRLGIISCKWIIERRQLRADQQLVLQGLPMRDPTEEYLQANTNGTNSPHFTVAAFGKRPAAVTTGIFLVHSAMEKFPLTVKASWDPKSQRSSQVKLRLLLVHPGLCARDMLSFNGSCYAVSPVRRIGTAAMADLGGNAQLASFSSMAEIRSLIAANTAGLSKFPYKRPLNLRQAVRIGLFYGACDASVVSSACSSGNRSQLRPVQSPDEFLGLQKTGPCATLKADESDSAMVEFSECSSPLPVLIKFPDSSNYGPNVLSGCRPLAAQEFIESKACFNDKDAFQTKMLGLNVSDTQKSRISARTAALILLGSSLVVVAIFIIAVYLKIGSEKMDTRAGDA